VFKFLAGLFMIKWDDQSRFRNQFSMEWYVLGNGPWDYSALHPKQQHGSSGNAAAAAAVDEATGLGSSVISSKLPRKAGKALNNAQSSSSSSISSSQVLGWQYSGYPNGSHAEGSAGRAAAAPAAAAAVAAAAAAVADGAGFNTIEAGVVAATRSLFTGQLDGQKFMPQRTGKKMKRGSSPASKSACKRCCKYSTRLSVCPSVLQGCTWLLCSLADV
jgi:hypothetical protein